MPSLWREMRQRLEDEVGARRRGRARSGPYTPGMPRRPMGFDSTPPPYDPRGVAPQNSAAFAQDPGMYEPGLPPDPPPSRDLARSGVRILRPETAAPPTAAVVEIDDHEHVEHAVVHRDDADVFDGDAFDAEPPRLKRPNVLGVNIASGMAHLAVVDTAGRSLLRRDDCVAPPEEAPEGVRLAAFASGIGRALRANDVGVVAVARPLRYTNWTYKDAFDRISLETCIVLEAQRLGVRYESVGQHHAANVIGLPLERLGDLLSSRLAVAKTRSWPDRWPALLVALATAAA